MRPNLVPSDISPLLPFQSCTQSVLEKTDVTGINGSTSIDGYFSWLYHGPHLEVITTKSRTRVAAWKFGAALHDSNTTITCVQEYSVNGSTKLLVGLTNSVNQGMVCLFDIFKSCVLKAIEFPQKVTSLTSVLTSGGDQVPSWAIGSNLREFHGIVAVGVQCGYVYLVDMCVDSHAIYDEVYPSTLQFMTPRSRDVGHARQQALSKGNVMAMLLNEECCSRGSFTFYRPDDSIVKTFQTDSVSVSCLQYVPQAGILCVGFNFGGFQLWKLYNPVMEYNSRLEAEPNAVSHFLYQEPENDPKNFCYLWVSRDNSVVYPGQENVSTICLYQLCFGKKTLYNNYGVFYEELESVCLRLEYELLVDPFSGTSRRHTWMSQIVSCYTLVDPFYCPPAVLTENESFEEGGHGPDLALCVIVWEAQDNGPGDKSNYFLALFDINRWYHAQMPSSVRFGGVSSEMCPYFAVYRLNDITDAALPDVMLHLHVRRNSIKRFINNAPLPPEQHFYPSALSFDGICLMETGIIKTSFLGLQKQVLSEMRRKGAVCLLQPQDLYNTCLLLGLLPKQDIGPLASNLSVQRQALLTMALDYPMISVIVGCIEAWADGEFVHQGCTLKFLLDWTWEQVSNTKRIIDDNCRSLYDWSGKHVDSRLLHTLHKACSTLCNLLSILEALIQSAPSTEEGLMELESKQNVLSLLVNQLQVVLWFIDAKLLPEDDDAVADANTLFCYPFCKLEHIYNSRRTAIRQLHSEMKGTELLLIDGLVKSCGPELGTVWKREGGNGLYPPPSLHALLGVYLLLDVSLDQKHAVTLYMLFDLISLLPEDKEQVFSDKIAEFAKTFSISQLFTKTSGFWLLDHQDYNDAFQRFMDPSVGTELGSWQHMRIVKTFLFHGEQKMALRYLTGRNVPVISPEQVKLKLTVLLANGLATEAFNFQRQYRNRRNMSDLLSHLFRGCQQMKLLDQLLQLPLNEVEEHHLVEFLSQNTEYQEILVMYYLQRARFIEAIRLNEKLRQGAMSEKNSLVRERSSTRNLIVDGFARLLPESQRKLIQENPELATSVEQRIYVKRPRPLSTLVRKPEHSRVQSFSRLILGYMHKVHENQRTTEDTEERVDAEKDLGPFLRTPVTPRKKSRLSEVPDVSYPAVKQNDSYDVSDFNSPVRSKDPTRRKSRFRSADTLIMLKTPEVCRKMRDKSSLLAVQRTPQSILKVRRLIKKSPSPGSSLQDLTTPKNAKKKRSERVEDKSVGRSAHGVSTTPRQRAVFRKTGAPELDSTEDLLVTATVDTSSSEVAGDIIVPKHLRFAEPAEEEEGEVTPPSTPLKLRPTCVTLPSPSSPRLLRDRSPTPESLSPKLMPRLDNLTRQPLRAHTESPQWITADSEGEITFNLTKTQTIVVEEAMEVDTESPPNKAVTVTKTTETCYTQRVESSTWDDITSEVREEHESVSVVSETDRVSSIAPTSDLGQSELSVPAIDLSNIDVLDVDNFLLTPGDKGKQVDLEVLDDSKLSDKPQVVELQDSEKGEMEGGCVEHGENSDPMSEKRETEDGEISVPKSVTDIDEAQLVADQEWKLEIASSDDQEAEEVAGVKSREVEDRASCVEEREKSDVVMEEPADEHSGTVTDSTSKDQQVDEQSIQKVDEQPIQQVDERSIQQVNEQSIQQVDEQSIQQVDERPIQQVDERSIQQVDERSIQQVDEQSIQKVDEQPIQQVDEWPIQQVDEPSVQQVDEQSIQQVDERSVQQVVKQLVQQVEEPSIQQVDEPSIQQVEEQSIQQVDERSVQQVVKQLVQQVDESSIQQVDEPSIQQVDEQSIQQVDERSVQQVVKQLVQQVDEQVAVKPVDLHLHPQADVQQVKKCDMQQLTENVDDKQVDVVMDVEGRESDYVVKESSPLSTVVMATDASMVPVSKDVVDVVSHIVEQSVQHLEHEKTDTVTTTLKPSDSELPELSKHENDAGTKNEKIEKPSDSEEMISVTTPTTPPRQGKPSPSRSRRTSTRKSSVSEDIDINFLDSPARSTRSARRSMTPSSITATQSGSADKSETPTPQKSPGRSARGKGASASRKIMQASPARPSRKSVSDENEVCPVQMTKLKAPLPVLAEEFEVAPISPIRRSPRIMMNSLTKQLHSEDSTEASVPEHIVTRTRSGRSATPTTPSRRSSRRSEKGSESEGDLTTPVKPTLLSVTLTPPDSSSRGTTDKSSQQKQSRKKKNASPMNVRGGSPQRSLRSQDKQQPPSESALNDSVTQAAPSFLFAEPMSVDPHMFEKSGHVESPLRSFIFSPPVTRQTSRRDSLGRMGQSTPHISSPLLLSAGSAEPAASTASTRKTKGRPRKAVKESGFSTPEHTEESVILLTPYELRHPVTRTTDNETKARSKVLLKRKKRVHRII
ncbi:protein ELYS-like [Gigantopelta aegis]|uniref:protein ELYS-like n=1 Tax=Gigantopelta aegis TaxID=1735272 RepID=UPI001B88968B|nr:protein ELYS-like [Gigantopelta aegis]